MTERAAVAVSLFTLMANLVVAVVVSLARGTARRSTETNRLVLNGPLIRSNAIFRRYPASP
jgi:hypothetical protein